MRLLVSVATADDARAAIEGGADIVDAKDPAAGALGAVTLERFGEIQEVVAGASPLTAALGDATGEHTVARDARGFAEAGAWLVKLGLLGTTDRGRAEVLLAAAVSGTSGTGSGVVAVAYADADPVLALPAEPLVAVASRAGARGVLIDTMDKRGPGLLRVLSVEALRRWIAAGRDAGLLVAVAGKLQGDDLALIADMGADVAGVRGAACPDGRRGLVSAGSVADLKRLSRWPARGQSESPPPPAGPRGQGTSIRIVPS